MQRIPRVDRILGGIVILLVVGGLLIFLSASLGLLTKDGNQFASAAFSQVVLGLGGGGLALFALMRIPLKLLRRYSFAFLIAALFLTLLVFVPGLGLSINGAQRWLDLRVITFQPAELLKVAYILYIAAWCAGGKSRVTDIVNGLMTPAILTGVVGVLLLLQPDTDTFLVIASAGVAIIFAAGMKVRHLLVIGVAAVVLLGILVMARPYLWDRVATYLDPTRDPLGSGYQIQQSLIAVGSGEVFGRGFGQSIQKFNYLPEASSDSIFAVYAEESGFVGSVLLVFGFLFFALRGLWVAARASDMFSGLVALGIVTLITVQSFLNIAAMLGVLPVGGLPLPFVSHGGSALLITLGMVGILLNVSKNVRV